MLRGDNMEYINQNANGVRMSLLYLFPHSFASAGTSFRPAQCISCFVASSMFDTPILNYIENIFHTLRTIDSIIC